MSKRQHQKSMQIIEAHSRTSNIRGVRMIWIDGVSSGEWSRPGWMIAYRHRRIAGKWTHVAGWHSRAVCLTEKLNERWSL